MIFSHPMVKLKDLLSPIDREVLPQSGVVYRQIGVKWWGKGAYERDAVSGDETKYNKFNQVKTDDIVINKIWARHGSICVIPEELDGCYVSTEFPIFEINKDKLSPRWFQIMTRMKFFWTECDKYSSGTSGKNRIKPGMFLEIEIPLPALEEQVDIIEYIDKYYDQLSIISVHREKAINDYYHLKNSILQEAMQGRLVPQNPNDEPASALLEKIKAEKERLIKEKKVKKEKPLPPVKEDEIPYKLPQGWEWVRLGQISFNHGQKIPNQKFTYIDVGSINKEKGIISNQLTVLKHDEAPSRARKIVKSGSVIYSTVRPYLLNIAIVDRTFDYEPIVSTAFAVMHPFSQIHNKFLYYFLRSKPFVEYVESQMVGMTYPAINDSKLYNGLFPLPPLNEQKRIVEKVDQLMALCDELEKTVEKTKQESEKLMQAVLEEAFSKPKKASNIVEFPTSVLQEAEEEWDMVARAEGISPETQAEIAATLEEIKRERQ